jgi:hypothetical protein
LWICGSIACLRADHRVRLLLRGEPVQILDVGLLAVRELRQQILVQLAVLARHQAAQRAGALDRELWGGRRVGHAVRGHVAAFRRIHVLLLRQRPA